MYVLCLRIDVKPVAIFPFDECHSDGNTVYDISGSGLIGNRPANGATFTYGPNGNPTGAIHFAGNSENYVEIPKSHKIDAKRSITIMAMIFPTEFQYSPIATYVIKLENNDEGRGVSLMLTDDGLLEFNLVKRPVGTVNSLSTLKGISNKKIALTKNAWNFVAATYDFRNNTVNLYVNSSSLDTPLKLTEKTELATNGKIRVGAVKGYAHYFYGQIACLRIYSASLSAEQIAASEECPIRK